eukprot:6193875-Pleurochrysis_carterae.AAC.3
MSDADSTAASCPRPSLMTQWREAASGNTFPCPTPTAQSSACIDRTPAAHPSTMKRLAAAVSSVFGLHLERVLRGMCVRHLCASSLIITVYSTWRSAPRRWSTARPQANCRNRLAADAIAPPCKRRVGELHPSEPPPRAASLGY